VCLPCLLYNSTIRHLSRSLISSSIDFNKNSRLHFDIDYAVAGTVLWHELRSPAMDRHLYVVLGISTLAAALSGCCLRKLRSAQGRWEGIGSVEFENGAE